MLVQLVGQIPQEWIAMVPFELILTTLVFMVFDILTGYLAAIKMKSFSSTKQRDGIWHKIGFLGLIFFSYLVQIALSFGEFPFEVPTIAAICLYLIVTEMTSIFENLCIINPVLKDSPFGSIFDHDERIEEADAIEEEQEAGNGEDARA